MKTMFTMGFAPQQSVFGLVPQQNVYAMGQDQSTGSTTIINLAPSDRNKMLTDINRGAEEYKAMAAWKNATANWQALLGNDLASFNDNLSRADEFSGSALAVQGRLSAPGTSWNVNGDEYNAVTYWTGYMDGAFKLMTLHVGAVKAPTGPAIVPAPSTGPSPVVIGVGAAAAVGLLAVLLG